MTMRDNAWLENRLDEIWEEYFSDIEKINEVTIKFGRSARTRLGSIRRKTERVANSHKNTKSEIIITGYFKDEIVPEYMIDLTIAHELCHYAHGFSSPHPQLMNHPHRGNIVDKELIKRGLGDQLLAQKKWLKDEWPTIVKLKVKSRKSKVRVRTRTRATRSTLWKLFFN